MGHTSALFLAKGGGSCGLEGCPDLRRFADHSGGTVADSNGLPRFPNLLIVEQKSKSREVLSQPEAGAENDFVQILSAQVLVCAVSATIAKSRIHKIHRLKPVLLVQDYHPRLL